ncbi:fibronectin type III domain-containing protein (plasmid) [Apilactobacillus apisilvae]|uniref:Fibronectin type III domain-containing protein n=1 Tax=Apilactobacillus apisilvae TaxID=2923364 RepID=A0ABY4PIX8_9LACO|nr:fibronectin type III domain-containing protein [Apilactobacillus apisilvae]UQS85826.1 fibronectin type III domain-containing protein [Apilactobacillus apisilvae]
MVKLFRNTALTTAGFQVANKAAVGLLKYEITRAASTDMDLTQYTDDELKNLTSLPNEIDSGEIVDRDDSKDDNSLSTISTLFNNKNYEKGYTIKAVGIYGKTDEGKEFLHSVTVSETPVIVPEWTTNKFDGLGLDVVIVSGDNKHMDVDLSDAGTASIGYVQKALAKIDLSSATTKANEYTDSQLKNYTNTLNMNNLLNGKQDKGNYVTSEQLDAKDYATTKSVNGVSSKLDQLGFTKTDRLYVDGKPVLVATAPNAPKLSASINSDTGNLDYKITPPKIDGGASITKYQISYKKKKDNDWNIINVDAEQLNGTLSNLEKGSIYQLKAVAINYAGSGVGSDTVTVLTAVAPKDVTIQVNNEYPKVSYSINVGNNGGADVQYYQLFYKKDNDSYWQFIDHPNSSGLISNLENNCNYLFKAKAGNAGGLSVESDISILNFVDNNVYGVTWNRDRNNYNLDRIGSSNVNNAAIFQDLTTVRHFENDYVRIPKFYINKVLSTNSDIPYKWEISMMKHDESWYLPKCFWSFKNNKELPYVDICKSHGSIFSNEKDNGRLQLLDMPTIDVLTVLTLIFTGNLNVINPFGVDITSERLFIDGIVMKNDTFISYKDNPSINQYVEVNCSRVPVNGKPIAGIGYDANHPEINLDSSYFPSGNSSLGYLSTSHTSTLSWNAGIGKGYFAFDQYYMSVSDTIYVVKADM